MPSQACNELDVDMLPLRDERGVPIFPGGFDTPELRDHSYMIDAPDVGLRNVAVPGWMIDALVAGRQAIMHPVDRSKIQFTELGASAIQGFVTGQWERKGVYWRPK